MSDQLDTLIRSADPIPTAADVPAAAWLADQTWSAVRERIRDVDATVPVWRRPGVAVATATLLLVVALGALLIVRDPDAEPTIDSTVPVPTTIARPTTTLPPTTTTTTTPASTTAPPTTVSAEEVVVGGLPATRVDFELTTGMTYLQPNQQFAFILPPGTRATSFVLSVDGETVSIVAFAPDQDQHTDLLELALPIVESIEWADV